MIKAVLSGNTYEVKDAIKNLINCRWDSRRKHWYREVETKESILDPLERIKEQLTTAGVRVALFDQQGRLIDWRDFGDVKLFRERNNEQQAESEEGSSGSYRVTTRNVTREEEENRQVIVTIPIWLARELGCATRLEGRIVAREIREMTIRGNQRHVFAYHFVGQNAIGGTERCHRCHRPLTHPVSRVIGYGPECCQALGISRRVDMNDLNNVEVMRNLIQAQQVDVWIPARWARTN